MVNPRLLPLTITLTAFNDAPDWNATPPTKAILAAYSDHGQYNLDFGYRGRIALGLRVEDSPADVIVEDRGDQPPAITVDGREITPQDAIDLASDLIRAAAIRNHLAGVKR